MVNAERGMGTKTTAKSERLELRVDGEFIEKLDDWRRKQPDIPSRSSAIRQLVAVALQHKGKQ